MRNDPFGTYRTHEWFESLKWQHMWIEFMVGWWAGTWGKPKTIVDFGAGDGWWPHSFKQVGSEHGYGVELDDIAAEHMPSDIYFIQHDLREQMLVQGTSELVMCFEVAEHLPKNDALNALLPTLVKSTSNLIAFSAAPPGQEGTGHINLHDQFYWIEQFEKHPYIKLNNERTAAARRAFENIVPEGLAFLPRNLLIFSRL